MAKHKNLSIFVPHEGCPNRCSFCDQKSISGTNAPPTPQEVTQLCERFLPSEGQGGEEYEIAFFGGSFTAIDHNYMTSLLAAAYPFVQGKRAAGIRISTRPDAIDEDILHTLQSFGVTSIELGAQSMQDEVLRLNMRGHTAQQVVSAAKLIKQEGFSLGLQMMTGLYGQKDYNECALDTAQQFVKLCPDTVRIYPTITLAGTLLAQLYAKGEYTPPTLEQTVDICARLIEIFDAKGIKIIKLGLHADEGMQQKIVAGPYHPAFRELCLSKLFLEKIKDELTTENVKNCIIKVNPSRLSQFKGQKSQNIKQLEKLGITAQIISDSTVLENNFKIETINYSEG
ncbi:MAG: radical SAM protein [Oscillospiraceae bacterium]